MPQFYLVVLLPIQLQHQQVNIHKYYIIAAIISIAIHIHLIAMSLKSAIIK